MSADQDYIHGLFAGLTERFGILCSAGEYRSGEEATDKAIDILPRQPEWFGFVFYAAEDAASAAQTHILTLTYIPGFRYDDAESTISSAIETSLDARGYLSREDKFRRQFRVYVPNW